MERRQLSEKEKDIYNKKISVLEKAKDLNEGEIKRFQFDLDFLIDHESKLKRIHTESAIKKIKHELDDINENINTLTKHLKEGVEVKENGRDGHNQEQE